MSFFMTDEAGHRARKHEHFPLRVPESTNIPPHPMLYDG
jgi:hypothetical protein